MRFRSPSRVPLLSFFFLFALLELPLPPTQASAAVACKPLVHDSGDFLTTSVWSTTPSASRNGRTVTWTASAITVSGPSGTLFHSNLPGHTSKYMILGTQGNVLLLNTFLPGDGTAEHSVTVVDFTQSPPVERLISTTRATGTSVPVPKVQVSQSAGSAFLVYGYANYFPTPGAPEVVNLGIFRADVGTRLCLGPSSFVQTGDILGKASAAGVTLSYSSDSTRKEIFCAWPAAHSKVEVPVPDFCAAVGRMDTDSFNIVNDGSDCLLIDSIPDRSPFRVSTTFPALPTALAPGEILRVNVTFKPTAAGPIDADLAILPAPPGDSVLKCKGDTSCGPPPAASRIYCGTGDCDSSSSCCAAPAGGSIGFTQRFGNDKTATAALTLSKIEVTSPAGVFSLASPPALGSVLPGGLRDVRITFTPRASAPATYMGELVVHSNDAAKPVLRCAFAARSPLPVPRMEISPNPLDHGDTELGGCAAAVLTVKNTGGECSKLVVTATDLSAGDPQRDHWSALGTGGPLTVAAGRSTTLMPVFEPRSAGGPYRTRIEVAGNDPARPSEVVTLTGTCLSSHRTDLATWRDAGEGWIVAASTGLELGPRPRTGWLPWISGFGGPFPGYMLTGDFNGDGLTDIAGWNPPIKAWHVALSTGKRFDSTPEGGGGTWITRFGSPAPGFMLTGDFDGDGRTDIAGWNKSQKGWHVALSTGTSFDPEPEGGGGGWISGFGRRDAGFMLTGDFDGDGRTDIAGWNPGRKGWHVALSTGHDFDPTPEGGGGVWIPGFGKPSPGFMLTGDFDGDGLTDIAGWNRGVKGWHVALARREGRSGRFDSTPEGGGGMWITGFGSPEAGTVQTGDFDGDGRTDLAAWDDGDLTWHVALSTGRSFDREAGFKPLRAFSLPGWGSVLVGNFGAACARR